MEHLVESHLGGYYISNQDPEIIEEYCEECGDCDWILLSWEEGNKMNALLKYFSKLDDTNELFNTCNSSIPKEDVIDDLLFDFNRNRNIINILAEGCFISHIERLKLLRQVHLTQKKQFELLKKSFIQNDNNKVKTVKYQIKRA